MTDKLWVLAARVVVTFASGVGFLGIVFSGNASSGLRSLSGRDEARLLNNLVR